MTDKEFEELKRKVAEETQRRSELVKQKTYIHNLKNGMGLKIPDGRVNRMRITIVQEVNYSTGIDGNGPREEKQYKVILCGTECDLLFEAFKEMAILCEKKIRNLEYEDRKVIENE